MSSATRLPCLDGLRGIAAIGVMLFHFNRFFLPRGRFFVLAAHWWEIMPRGT
jgi:peptidoglycan/LPS O-acetylase OafA/YrhL